SRFGVAVEKDGRITDFVEKPSEPISNLAIIGVYYFKEAEKLKKQIEYLLEHDVRGHGREFQLTDALDRLLKNDHVFKKAAVDEWLDCGTLPAWLETSGVIVEKEYREVDPDEFGDTKIIPPVYIGEDVMLEDCVVGPYASIGRGSKLKECTVKNSLIQEEATLRGCNIENSTIGRNTTLHGVSQEVHLGDHSKVGTGI